VTDVLLHQESDGGNITLTNGLLTLDDGIATTVYLSLFGGNDDDSGEERDDPKQFWGNLVEDEPERHYRSRTQNLLQALPATTGNLRKAEGAVAADLEWMKTEGIATFAGARASLPSRNKIKIDIWIEVDSNVIPLSFVQPWGT